MDYKKAVENYRQTEQYNFFLHGDAYYRCRNSNIMNRQKQICIDGLGITQNPFMANHKLASGFIPKIVDQAVNYLVGNGIMWAAEGQTDALNEYFEHGAEQTLNEGLTTAGKKGIAWLYAYKDSGRLRFTWVKPEQVTPIYDQDGNIEKIIRCYIDGEMNVMLVYDADMVERYEKKLADTEYELIAKYGHYSRQQVYQGKMVSEEQHGFGKVPFFALRYNPEELSELYRIKRYIDIYDIIESDFANNIDDMQDAYFTLKGFAGEGKDMVEFMQQLKQYKAVPVPTDGDVTATQLQVPVEARETLLNRLERGIYKTAMAVDMTQLSGGSITNVMIKAQFSDLDLKCDKIETEVKKFLKVLIGFINEQGDSGFDYHCSFSRSMIMNEAEYVESLKHVMDTGRLSTQTFLEKLPFDIDVEQELERLESELQGKIDLDEYTEEAEEGDE